MKKIKCLLFYDDIISDSILQKLSDNFSAKSLIIPKKTKRGVSQFDIAKHISNVKINPQNENTVEIDMTISAGEPTVSTNDILNIACFECENQKTCQINVKRIEIFDKDMVLFK